MSMSPTQRTIRALRDMGRKCAIVEKFNPYVGSHGIRQDLFSIIDILCLDPERGVVGIQSCGSAFSEHYRKMTIEHAQETIDWLTTPGTCLELWGWRKLKLKRGGKAMVWRPKVKEITMEDFSESV